MHWYEAGFYIGANKLIELTPLENRILKILIDNKGKVTKYEQIIKDAYFEIYDFNDKAQRIKVNGGVKRLRKKLRNEFEIINKKSVGYMIL